MIDGMFSVLWLQTLQCWVWRACLCSRRDQWCTWLIPRTWIISSLHNTRNPSTSTHRNQRNLISQWNSPHLNSKHAIYNPRCNTCHLYSKDKHTNNTRLLTVKVGQCRKIANIEIETGQWTPLLILLDLLSDFECNWLNAERRQPVDSLIVSYRRQ